MWIYAIVVGSILLLCFALEGAGVGAEEIWNVRRLRRDNRVFHADADIWTLDTYNDHVLGIGRYYQGQKLLAFFNFSELGQIAWVNEQEEYTDLLTGKDRPARGVSLPGYGFAWLVTDFTENNS